MSRIGLILFGPPGSGKGTQAKLLLSQCMNGAHISTGDMLRDRVASGDALGREVAAIMQSGALVPDHLVNRMVEERIEQPDCAGGFILDGYPRTLNQAGLLADALSARNTDPVVVSLRVDYNVVITRLAGRRQCPQCGAVYSLSSEVCDTDGSGLVARDDDREEVVRRRLEAYERQTSPLADYFRSAGYAYYEVDGNAGAPREIVKRICGLLEEHARGEARRI